MGYEGGILTVYKFNFSSDSPICSMKAHQSDITGFLLSQEENALISISKDKSMKFWYPPISWFKDKKMQDE